MCFFVLRLAGCGCADAKHSLRSQQPLHGDTLQYSSFFGCCEMHSMDECVAQRQQQRLAEVDRTLEAPVIRTFTADAFSKTVARSVPGEASSSQSSSTAEVDSASEPSQREAGSGSSVGSAPEGHPLPPEPPESVAPSVLAVEQEYRSRPQARRARIRELLKRLEVAQSPCPADRMRVDARQRQAKERHLRQASGAPGAPQPSSPALSLRRSRSFMELVAQSEPHFSSARSSPVDPSLLEDVVSRLPAKSVTSCSSREPCTICLEPPASGRIASQSAAALHFQRSSCQAKSSPRFPAAIGIIPSVSKRHGCRDRVVVNSLWECGRAFFGLLAT